MRKILILTILLVLGSTMIYSLSKPFIKEYYQPKSIIVAFTKDSVGNKEGVVEFSKQNDVVKTNISGFNTLSEKFRFVDLVQMIDFVTNLDWHKDGVYVQNIYRVVLQDNSNIEQALLALMQEEYILFAEYESINRLLYTPNDPDLHMQWHHETISSLKAWDYVKGSKEVIIAITDTGTKWNHPDLADNIWINEAELLGVTIDWNAGKILGGNGKDDSGNGKIDDVIGWDFVDNDNNPYQNYEGNEHGTHVAGCAGAVGDNGIGVAGTALNVSLMICKGSPSNAPSDGVQYAYQQIQYAAQSRADIINCSWIGQGDGHYAKSVIDHATSLGSLVIGGAGNGNVLHLPNNAWYPADAENCIGVAATGSQDLKASFSDYGEAVDISAPGVNIRSTVLNDLYKSSQGTSMASPIVAGVAALIKTLHPHLKPTEIKQRLMFTADYIDDLNNEEYAGLLGFGRVNAFKATMYDLIPDISIFSHAIYEAEGDGDDVPNPGEKISLEVNLYNEIDWLTARYVTATLSTEVEGVEILVDTINYPVIGGGTIAFNRENTFIFKTDPKISNLKIPFTFTVYANPDNKIPYEKSFEIEVELSLQHAGWPLTIQGTSSSPAVITDIDRDGVKDIVFGDPQGNIHALHADLTYLEGFPVNVGNNINTALAIGDLTRDGKKEIVACTQNGIISCVNHKGEILFQYDTGGQIRANPMIIDVDNDGRFEIVALTFNNQQLIVLNRDGTDYPNFPVSTQGAVMSSPASADLDGDGYKEIIYTTSPGYLYAVSTKTGEVLNGYPVILGSASWNGPLVADITGAGKPQIILSTVGGQVFGYEADGRLFYQKVAGNSVRSGVLAYDLDGDGSTEVIFADMSGKLFITDSSGENLPGFPLDFGATIESTPILVDINNDGVIDVVFGDNNGVLHAVTMEGVEIDPFPIDLASSILVSPTIGFVKDDGNSAILVPNQNGYNYVDYKLPIGEIAWGLFKGNERRTGNYDDMLSIDKNEQIAPFVAKLNGNYPNPFNPETTISFSLGNASKVDLDIYNIRGQLVRNLLDTEMMAGEHTVVWNGTDSNGAKVGSGVYFYAFRAGEHIETRRMMLLK